MQVPQPPRPAPSAEELDRIEHWAFVCEASSCRWQGSAEVRAALARSAQEQGCSGVGVVRTGCLSLCGAGPAVVTYPAGNVHLNVQLADAGALVRHVAAGQALQQRAVRAPAWYRQSIVERLGYFVQLIKRRAREAAQPGGGETRS